MSSASDFNIHVNGNTLPNFVGSQVFLIGKGLQVGNKELKVESSDSQMITVKLSDQPNGNMSCLLEVIGTATGPKSITAKEVIPHPEWTDTFNMEDYSSVLDVIHSDKDCQEYVFGM